ncbi:ABC transporter ATP-binding protein/permease [Acholeplasma sp. OttesenSCG-928-E16]|nr:ABC transporter ATP-binding protein/permease [Acholeplasma sp. OttesenSCG-928-E16]
MLQIRNIKKTYYPKKGEPVVALNNVSIDFNEKGMVFILGKSGSGKSTLLNLLGGLDKYDSGEIIIKDKSSINFSQADFDSYRNTYVGFIFQEYNILDEFSIGKNIGLALELQNEKADQQTIEKILSEVDLVGYANRKPAELSGGQKQRVAIARALIKNPEIILADEPTGALDSNTGKQVFETLKKLSKEKLVIIVSHDREYAEYYGDRVIEFKDGEVISDITKYQSKSTVVSDGISIIDNKIVHVKKGHKLSSKEKEDILAFIETNESDIILSKDVNSNLDFKKGARIDNDGNKESFRDTIESDYKKDEITSSFKLIKGRLPIRYSLKMALSSLKTKPIRLFFTILLSAISIALFGIADTAGSYDKYNNSIRSLRDSNINALTFTKEQKISDWYSVPVPLLETDLKDIETKYSDFNFHKSYKLKGFSLRIFSGPEWWGDSNPYFLDLITNYTVISNEFLNDFGYSLEGSLPILDNEIVLSKYAAEGYVKYGIKDNEENIVKINSYQDLIGKNLYNNSEVIYKVVGILDTNFDASRYADVKESGYSSNFNYMELTTLKEYGFHSSLFVSKDFAPNTKDTVFEIGDNYNVFMMNANYSEYWFNHSMFYSSDFNTIFFDDNKDTLNTNEITVSSNTLDKMFSSSGAPNYYNDVTKEFYNAYENYVKNIYFSISDKFKEYVREELESQVVSEDRILEIINSLNYSSYLRYLEDEFSDENPLGADILSGEEILELIHSQLHKEYVENVNKYIDDNNISFSFKFKDMYNDEEKSLPLTLVGISFFEYGYVSCSMTEKTYNDNFPVSNIYQVSAGLNSNDSRNVSLAKHLDILDSNDYHYSIKDPVNVLISQLNNTIEQIAKYFIYVGIGFAVFAALLLFNFISTSITYKKREIGILRAIGAKSSDVFKIFFLESLIISLISFIIGLVIALTGIYFLLLAFRNQIGLLITILVFGIRQAILMLLISIAVALIASFIPVYSTSRKKPVDAIKNL